MQNKLIEISKGTGKGLISVICSASIMGLPAAEDLYSSIKSKQGQTAYKSVFSVAIAALIAGGTAAIYSNFN